MNFAFREIPHFRHRFEFWIPGRPRSWSRDQQAVSKGGKPFTFKSRSNVDAQRLVKHAFMDEVQAQRSQFFPWQGPVSLSLYFVYERPKNWFEGREKFDKPDYGNLVKNVEDGLIGAAWKDDCQIVQAWFDMFFCPPERGNFGGTVVVMRLYDAEEKPTRGRKKNG